MAIYPTNNYTTIDLDVNNISDYREKRMLPVNDPSTGLSTLDHPTRTLYDFENVSSTDTSAWVNTLGYTLNSGVIHNFIDAFTALNAKQKNYLVKEKQIKLLRLTERMRKVAFEVQRLSSEEIAASSDSLQSLPMAQESIYPSSQTIRTFKNR